jgi:hypothetical protein
VDGTQFDRLTASFASGDSTRRSLLRRAGVGAFATLLAALGASEVDARRRGRRGGGGGGGGGGGSSSSSSSSGGGGGSGTTTINNVNNIDNTDNNNNTNNNNNNNNNGGGDGQCTGEPCFGQCCDPATEFCCPQCNEIGQVIGGECVPLNVVCRICSIS